MPLANSPKDKHMSAHIAAAQILIRAGINAVPLAKEGGSFVGILINGELANLQFNSRGDFLNTSSVHEDVYLVAVYSPATKAVTVYRYIELEAGWYWSIEIWARF